MKAEAEMNDFGRLVRNLVDIAKRGWYYYLN